jgi:hypothetical protein
MIPAGTTDARVEYRVTGHGGSMGPNNTVLPGCIGPAEEFCKRTHHLLLDGTETQKLTPWRSDCATLCTYTTTPPSPFGKYCAENPCGNPQSVMAPRANWCPGSMTPPIVYTPDGILTPGMHTFNYAIDGVVDQWRVSAVMIATAASPLPVTEPLLDAHEAEFPASQRHQRVPPLLAVVPIAQLQAGDLAGHEPRRFVGERPRRLARTRRRAALHRVPEQVGQGRHVTRERQHLLAIELGVVQRRKGNLVAHRRTGTMSKPFTGAGHAPTHAPQPVQ